jgi:dihydroorotase
MHVHFRQPGKHEYKETIKTGSRAAAKGGFTTVVCEPNTVPPIDDWNQRVKRVLDIAKHDSVVNLYTKACISKGMKGKKIVNVWKVIQEGAVALTDDGFPVSDINIMSAAAGKAVQYGIPLCPHCEESRLWGRRDAINLERRMNYHQETDYIRRDIHVAKDTGCSIHFPHVSLATSVQEIRKAKSEGVPVTAEATPHHFTLTWEEGEKIGENAIVNPPLRSAKDVEAIKVGLRDGTIDVIATDHAPHAWYEKKGRKPPFGIIGLETTLGIVLTHLVDPGVLSLVSAIRKMTANPARILNLKRGDLGIGMPADITIIDLNKEWVVDVKEFESKGRNCPFDGWKLKGKAVMTIVGGKVVMNQGKIIDPPTEDLRLLQQLRFSI